MLLSPILGLVLTSATFKNNSTMPVSTVARACGGSSSSPQLSWRDVPKGTKSFALIVHDPDAPRPGGFYHWVIPDIPAHTTNFARDVAGFGTYHGPCPPPGKVHHYHFTLYALDTVIDTSAPLKGPDLIAMMKGHILAQTTLTGLFEIKP